MKSVARLYATPSSDFSLDASGQDVSCRDSPVSVAALLRENAELRQTLASLQGLHDLAYHDALTGLWNRRYFEERMTEELARARRDPESPFTLVIVDLNNMKQINDCHGHEAGDRSLKWIARFFSENLRAYDVTFRLGGDEFALLLPSTRAEDAAYLITRLRRELAAANTCRDIPIGLSFGAATYLKDDTTDITIFVRADKAMYEDKRRQRSAA
jgi:diguanylate cyclase (GGDEF)-like protein